MVESQGLVVPIGLDAIQAKAEATLHESFMWAAKLAKNATAVIQDEYKFTFDDHCTRLFSVRPNLVAVEFPSRDRRRYLAKVVNSNYGSDYLVVNLSGETYDTSPFQGPVMDVVLSGCVPPLEVLLRLCVSAHAWLGRSPTRHLVVHGADAGWLHTSLSASSLGPAVVLLACYLSWMGLAAHPLDAMLEVCDALGISESLVQPSQRRYLNYFELLHRGAVGTTQIVPVRIKRIVLVGVGGDDNCRTLEIWQQDQLLFSTELDAVDAVGAVVHVGVSCSGDMSIRILRANPSSKKATDRPQLEMQVCFHASFIVDGFVRFSHRDIDAYSPSNIDGCSVDVFVDDVESAPDNVSQESQSAATAATVAIREGPRKSALQASAARTSIEPEPLEVMAEVGTDTNTAVDHGPQFFDLSAEDAPGDRRIVFAPDDIDAFFDDLF